jgi:hypothetical protein
MSPAEVVVNVAIALLHLSISKYSNSLTVGNGPLSPWKAGSVARIPAKLNDDATPGLGAVS